MPLPRDVPPENPLQDSSSEKHPPRRRPLLGGVPPTWILLLVGLGLLLLLFVTNPWETHERLPYSFFKQQLLSKNVKDVKIGSTRLLVELKKAAKPPEELKKKELTKFSVLRPNMDDQKLIEQLDDKNNAVENYDFEKDSMSSLLVSLSYILPMVLLLVFIVLMMSRWRDPLGGGFLNSYIKSPAKKYEKGRTRVTFDDVAGMENAKSELVEVVDFLRSPEKYQRLGGMVPKGVLLVGPPGCGKTMIAKAVAGEAGCPFYSMGGSEFIQMFVGVGASRVRDLFRTARENAPCILFIDEIDAVGRVRGAGLGGGHDEREQTLNQILSEMDGFLPTESVIVLAATNRPDVLDPALLRPGRFDRHITIDRPTWQGRVAILKVHTRDKPLADDVDLENIAKAMIGMTGADLRNLANESALIATRHNKSKIERSDFTAAADRILVGVKREEVLSPEEKRRTAYHEAGHALAAWYEPHADPLFKLTIIPRGQSLGMTRFMPEEDRLDHTRSKLWAMLVMAMGGRAADRLIFDERTSGAAQDLKQATRIAKLMVTQFGMSERLGPVSYRHGEEHVFLGKEISESRDFSEGTAQVIDEEVRRLLREADDRAVLILQDHREQLDLLVDALLQKEELLKDEIEHLLRTGKLETIPQPSADGKDDKVAAVEEAMAK